MEWRWEDLENRWPSIQKMNTDGLSGAFIYLLEGVDRKSILKLEPPSISEEHTKQVIEVSTRISQFHAFPQCKLAGFTNRKGVCRALTITEYLNCDSPSFCSLSSLLSQHVTGVLLQLTFILAFLAQQGIAHSDFACNNMCLQGPPKPHFFKAEGLGLYTVVCPTVRVFDWGYNGPGPKLKQLGCKVHHFYRDLGVQTGLLKWLWTSRKLSYDASLLYLNASTQVMERKMEPAPAPQTFQTLQQALDWPLFAQHKMVRSPVDAQLWLRTIEDPDISF